jgi:hypothetical protein
MAGTRPGCSLPRRERPHSVQNPTMIDLPDDDGQHQGRLTCCQQDDKLVTVLRLHRQRDLALAVHPDPEGGVTSRALVPAAERHLRLAVDPLREGAQRELMRALSAGGESRAARQVYQGLRVRLHRELRAAPDPETSMLFEESLAICRELGDKPRLVQSLEGLAAIAGHLGRPERAARLFGVLAALRDAIGLASTRRSCAFQTARLSFGPG